jgi:hypothetical protein
MPSVSAATVPPTARIRDVTKLCRKLSTVKTLRIHLIEKP